MQVKPSKPLSHSNMQNTQPTLMSASAAAQGISAGRCRMLSAHFKIWRKQARRAARRRRLQGKSVTFAATTKSAEANMAADLYDTLVCDMAGISVEKVQRTADEQLLLCQKLGEQPVISLNGKTFKACICGSFFDDGWERRRTIWQNCCGRAKLAPQLGVEAAFNKVPQAYQDSVADLLADLCHRYQASASNPLGRKAQLRPKGGGQAVKLNGQHLSRNLVRTVRGWLRQRCKAKVSAQTLLHIANVKEVEA